jgi:Rad3-related DNA helicase
MIYPIDIGLPSKFTQFRKEPGFDQFKIASRMSSNDKRTSILQASTGSGKSVLNITSVLLQGYRTLYLTPSKVLQSQLMADFSSIGLETIAGHSNYPCAETLFDDSGNLIDFECQEGRESCPYWAQVEWIKSRSLVTSNIANWITIAKSDDPDRFGTFDCLIIDEAHNLPTMLCDLLSITISKRTMSTLLNRSLPSNDKDISHWVEWARELIPVCNESRKDKSLSKKDIQRLLKLSRDLHTIATITNEWVVEPTDHGSKLTPVYAEDYSEQWLFRGIPHIILSSATITSLDATYLGLTPDDYTLYEISSGFKASRRPFYYIPTVLVDYKMELGHKRLLVNRIDQIISKRLKVKGLIQSISYDYADMVKSLSSHKIITHGKHNKHVIDQFMSNPKPGILASPVISEGLDFADWKARYQIILKIPTSDSRHPLTAARKKRYKNWTTYLSGKTIQQMTGRIMRSSSDYGETFLLDKYWERYMKKSIPWPKYFRDSWIDTNVIPEPLDFD